MATLPNLDNAFGIAGGWRIRVRGGRYRLGDATLTVVADQEFEVAPPAWGEVFDERYARLQAWNPQLGPYARGEKLLHCQRDECAGKDALVPGSLRICLGPKGSEPLREGEDYVTGDDWATVGRLADGRLGPDQPVYASYRYGLQRLDSIFLDSEGRCRYRPGQARQALPKAPEAVGSEIRLANIWVPPLADALSEADLYPLIDLPEAARELVRVHPSEADRLLPKCRAALGEGRRLRILAWGDSVTDGGYLDDVSDRWQEQFVQRLRQRFPAATIDLRTLGWGGRNSRIFVDEPPGSPWNYAEQVLDARPDLIVSEFVNDTGLPPEDWEALYPRFLADFRAIGAEWIVLSPHYTRPDWMGLDGMKGCDDDPRPYVRFLRDFCGREGVPLADASRLWGRLWRQGLPYISLLANDINHPDERGMALFVDALMPWFG